MLFETSLGRHKGGREGMNSLLWIAQILLAAAFLFAAFSKILVYKRQTTEVQTPSGAGCLGMPDGLAAAIALSEIAGALALVIPIDLWPPHILVRLVASGLALLAVVVGIHQARRQEHTTPIVTMFFLAIFVIIGRWPG
jgi:uncharacterized membrane protein YphA (DoxX/SURF4 family)